MQCLLHAQLASWEACDCLLPAASRLVLAVCAPAGEAVGHPQHAEFESIDIQGLQRPSYLLPRSRHVLAPMCGQLLQGSHGAGGLLH